MDVVIGIAAKSVDGAYELAKVLHGRHSWSWQQPLGLQPREASTSSVAPEAAARLLLSHDTRTAYVLVATHATAEEWLRAAGAAQQHQSGFGREPEGLNGTAAAAVVTAVAVAAPPLQWLQQQHDAAVNVLLLQLFLTCDAVLVLLPTGQGLGLAGSAAGGGGGGGPLSGILEWMARLRLLQAAKGALHASLWRGGGQAAGSPSSSLQAEAQSNRGRPAVAGRVAAAAAAGEVEDDAGRNQGGGETEGLAQLRSWSGRSRPPALFFVSPSYPERLAAIATKLRDTATATATAAGTAPPRGASILHRAATPTTAATAASPDAPRDANSLLRSLLKRCRPVPLSATPESPQLCLLDPEALLVEPGPLVLEPADVQAVVLAALLEAGDGDFDASAVGVGRLATAADLPAATRREDKGLQRLADLLATARSAVAEGAEVEEEELRASSTAGGGGMLRGGRQTGGKDGAAAARLFCAAWRAAAAQLHDAVLAAWREAAARPLDWMPSCMEGAVRQVSLGHTGSTAQSRQRGRTYGQATAVAAAPPATAGLSQAVGSAVALATHILAPLEAAAAWLACGGGGGLASRLAAELSREAADVALRQYVAAAPPRYPQRVHAAAVAAAVAALRAAAPPGLAAGAAAAWLHSACEGEWLRVAARRQCSALSATGRPCTQPLHDASEPHCAETTIWVTCTTTGSGLMALPDPFDLQAANASAQLDDGARVAAVAAPPAHQHASAAATAVTASSPAAAAGGGRGKGGKRGGGGGATEPNAGSTGAVATATPPPSHPPPPPQQQQQPFHSRHLLIAFAQAADGKTYQSALGPWVTVTRLGPASSYNERRGLTNQPGLNGSCLHPLTLHLEAEPGAAGGPRSGSAGRGGMGSKKPGGGGGARPSVPRVASTGPDTPDAAGGSDSEIGVVLDEQSFPSLAEAAAAAAQSGRQQQGAGAVAGPRRGGGKQQASGKGSGGDALAAAVREREKLARAWPYPHSSAAFGNRPGSSPGGGGAGTALRAPLGGGTGGPPAARGRRGRSGTVAVVSGVGAADATAFPPISVGKDVKRVYVSYEYQTLDGRRFLATPQQLAAATATTGTSGALPSAALPGDGGTAGLGAAQQPGRKGAQRPPSGLSAATVAPFAIGSAAAAAATAAAAAAAATFDSGSSAASFLLQHDAPLYLQPPAGLHPDPTAPATAHDGAAAWDPTPRRPSSLAQLQRIFVVTPPSVCGEPLLAVRPTVQFRVLEPAQMPRDAAAAAGLLQPPDDARTAAGKDDGEREVDRHNGRRPLQGLGAHEDEQPGTAAQMVSGKGPAAVVVHVSLVRPVPLPPDSLVVVSLPLLYGLPADWLGWGAGLGSGEAYMDGGVATTSPGMRGAVNDSTDIPEDTTLEGAAANQSVQRGGPPAQAGHLVPLVQVDVRAPYEARLLAGSALFPVPVSEARE